MPIKKKETKKAKTKAVAKKSTGELSQDKFFNLFGEYTGYEKSKTGESQPFLKIAQSTTPEMSKKKKGYLPDLDLGDFFNSKSKTIFGSSVYAIQIGYYPYYAEFDRDRQFIRNYTVEQFEELKANDKLHKIDFRYQMKNGNDLVDTRAHFIILPEYLEEGMIIFALSSTGIKHSNRWMKLAKTIRNPKDEELVAPSYTVVWKIETTTDSNTKGQDFYSIGAGKETNIEFVKFVKPTREILEAIKNAMEAFKVWVERIEGQPLAISGEETDTSTEDEGEIAF